VAFYDSVLREAAALPGVVSVALSSGVPLAYGNTGMSIGTKAPSKGEPTTGVQASWRIVSPSYFETLDVPVLRGSIFARGTDPDANPSIVISRTLAEKLWPRGDDPVGRSAYLGFGQRVTIAAVVGDVRLTSIVREPVPAMYFPHWITLWPTMTMVVRSEGDPASLASSLRAAVARVDRTQPIFGVETMAAVVARRLDEPRLNATLLAIFAGLALALASVGVGGVMAYAVTRRTGELAVRQALGASPRQAMHVVLAGGLKVCAAGIIAGLAGALALGQSLASLLYGVAPRDLTTLIATSLALTAVAAVACWLPARRATRISPTLALREQ
jgi:putative ABC transport system permease protein